MLTLLEDTDGCANQYMCALATYLMTVISSSYGIIIYNTINAPSHENNSVNRRNATDKRDLKGEIDIIGKLANINKSNIGILTRASKDVSIKFSDQCIHILKNK